MCVCLSPRIMELHGCCIKLIDASPALLINPCTDLYCPTFSSVRQTWTLTKGANARLAPDKHTQTHRHPHVITVPLINASCMLRMRLHGSDDTTDSLESLYCVSRGDVLYYKCVCVLACVRACVCVFTYACNSTS